MCAVNKRTTCTRLMLTLIDPRCSDAIGLDGYGHSRCWKIQSRLNSRAQVGLKHELMAWTKPNGPGHPSVYRCVGSQRAARLCFRSSSFVCAAARPQSTGGIWVPLCLTSSQPPRHQQGLVMSLQTGLVRNVTPLMTNCAPTLHWRGEGSL